jgi:hypothetical protein
MREHPRRVKISFTQRRKHETSHLIIVYSPKYYNCGGRDSSDGIATPYGLGCTGIESRGGKIVAPVKTGPGGLPSLLYNGCRVSLLGVKRLGRGVNNPAPSSADVKERVELYIYSLSGYSWSVVGWTLLVPLLLLPYKDSWSVLSTVQNVNSYRGSRNYV